MVSSGLTDEKSGGLCIVRAKYLIGRSQGIESKEHVLAGDFTFENFPNKKLARWKRIERRPRAGNSADGLWPNQSFSELTSRIYNEFMLCPMGLWPRFCGATRPLSGRRHRISVQAMYESIGPPSAKISELEFAPSTFCQYSLLNVHTES